MKRSFTMLHVKFTTARRKKQEAGGKNLTTNPGVSKWKGAGTAPEGSDLAIQARRRFAVRVYEER